MSTFKVNTLQSVTGGVTTLTKQHAAKLIVKYNMSGAVQGTSLNVYSVVDSATGRHSQQFTKDFTTAKFVFSATTSDTLGGSNHAMIVAQDYGNTVSSSETRVGMVDGDDGNVYSDTDFCSVTLFGDLA